MSNATIEEVLYKTGREVDQPTIDQAEGMIETLTGIIMANGATLTNRRDAYWLKTAVCYQSAWLADQPDFHFRLDVTSTQQDGVQASFKPDALILAPMAKRAIKRLSWRGTRTLMPLGPGERRASSKYPQGDDETEPWRRL